MNPQDHTAQTPDDRGLDLLAPTQWRKLSHQDRSLHIALNQKSR